MTAYKILWDNGGACGTLSGTFTNKRNAEHFARNWKREMVALDDDPQAARAAYSWELIALCRHCAKFAMLNRTCTAQSHLQCDCPKCQGFCECD